MEYNDLSPIYNSRIVKVFIEYLKRYYPEVDLHKILEYSGISFSSIEDQAIWFNQEQMDRFHEIIVNLTKNERIARDAGRYSVTSGAMGAAQQYSMGLMGLSYVYLLMGKLYNIMSRGATVEAIKLGPNKVEVISKPSPGVNEKNYQCENRIGIFESLAKFFTDKYAMVEHPECYHRGDEYCRYIITWEKNRSMMWKTIRNFAVFFSVFLTATMSMYLDAESLFNLSVFELLIIVVFSFLAVKVENKELAGAIAKQGDAAKDLMYEIDLRHNNSLLVQEIGQALSRVTDIDELVNNLINTMLRRLDFDRGLIMLANPEKTRLGYFAGYGYNEEQERLLKETKFHLDNINSKGPFVLSFKKQITYRIDEVDKIEKNLSPRSVRFAKKLGAQSLICVPIVFQKESLGILAVDNKRSQKPLTDSDIQLLTGVASQAAMGIINARSIRRLQESEKKYRELVESANSIILRLDTKGNVTFFNKFGRNFFGCNGNSHLTRKECESILSDYDATKKKFEGSAGVSGPKFDEQIVTENLHELEDGKIVWVAWTYKPIFNSNGSMKELLCIGNDITALKNAEREKKELETSLQRARKMEALGTLAGGVAHDLNNILSGVVSYPELLLMDIPESSPLYKPILTIKKSGERAAAIVQDLLTLARRGVSVSEVVNLNEIVRDYFRSPEHENLRLRHPLVSIDMTLEENLPNILGSPIHLSKVVMNIVYNAAEAMPEGGIIRISTSISKVGQPIQGFEKIAKGDYVVISVSDAGVGISAEDMERIFEPFYTKKRMGRSGTGLGMAVVWGAVKDHKGYIDLKSSIGKGSTFSIYFPATRKEQSIPAKSSKLEKFMGNGEKLLIVDDVKEQREIACLMLSKLGYDAISVSSGEEALKYVQENDIDLLILDMIMNTGMDGLETFKKIKERKSSVRAVIASGYSKSAKVMEAQRLGAGGYLKKPYNIESLASTVFEELRG